MVHYARQRGSIEIVILVLVFAIAIGVVAWRVAETQNAQTDAERSAAIADNAPDVTAKYIKVNELSFSFLEPTEAGSITYEKTGEKTIVLYSSTLKDAKRTCGGEPTGEFGAITVAQKDEPKPVPTPAFTKIIGSKEYHFSSGIHTICYEENITKKFTETVPKAITNSIKEL
ncbi:MAG TPA: hypothetical protein VFZ58_03405 [Candidatus Saccharimonadales bacterium]